MANWRTHEIPRKNPPRRRCESAWFASQTIRYIGNSKRHTDSNATHFSRVCEANRIPFYNAWSIPISCKLVFHSMPYVHIHWFMIAPPISIASCTILGLSQFVHLCNSLFKLIVLAFFVGMSLLLFHKIPNVSLVLDTPKLLEWPANPPHTSMEDNIPPADNDWGESIDRHIHHDMR